MPARFTVTHYFVFDRERVGGYKACHDKGREGELRGRGTDHKLEL